MSVFSPGSEGIYAAMRMSYEKHLKLARKGKIGVPSDPPHYTALFGALATRNQVCGVSIDEVTVWLELSPFLYMEERESISTLSLYAVYREIPEEISEENRTRLTTDINQAVLKGLNKEPERIKTILAHNLPFTWIQLLSEETVDAIHNK